jgi:two-component system, OmpR family, phosphate regulon sensor histidine kinase PhoR
MPPLPTRNSPSRFKLFFKEQSILMALLKEFRDGILICDSQGLIIQFNRALKLFLQLDEQTLGQPVSHIISDTDFLEAVNTVLTTGESRVEEIMTWRGKTRKMFFEIHLVPVWMPINPSISAKERSTVSTPADLEKGEANHLSTEDVAIPDGCVVIFHDMTDIRRTEKMRRDFVANVSHELRTPLSAITGYSETLLDGALTDDPDVCRDFLQVIHRHSLRLTQLVEDLLDLSKLESPDYQPELLPVSLQGLIQQAFLLVEDKALEKQINITVDIQSPLPRVMAESSSMQQVLTNLLDNAIKYTPPQGDVEISAFQTRAGKIQVDVKDNGIGIEAKYLSRIFERFYRVDKARSRVLGGTGLGLSIVKHIVQLHGGEIRVDSVVNQGSTFSLTLNPEIHSG